MRYHILSIILNTGINQSLMTRMPSDRAARLDSQTQGFRPPLFCLLGLRNERQAFVKCSCPGIVTVFWGRYNYPWLAAEKSEAASTREKYVSHLRSLEQVHHVCCSLQFGFKPSQRASVSVTERRATWPWSTYAEGLQAEGGGFSGFEFNCVNY